VGSRNEKAPAVGWDGFRANMELEVASLRVAVASATAAAAAADGEDAEADVWTLLPG